MPSPPRLRVLTWHVHGSYLWYLSLLSTIDWVVPVKPGRPSPYGGRAGTRPWPDNLHEVPVEDLAGVELDCVLFQSHEQWLVDQHQILTPEQRALPRVFLEHDPPRQSPTDTRHPVADPSVLVVHCTHFNDLMWDCGSVPTAVVEHGVAVEPDVRATGELDRGLVIVNNLATRGRRLGADIFERVRKEVPLDLVGMGSEDLGGLGEIAPPDLPAFAARYRFVFNPIRYTSLGLAVLEAMTVGVPIVGLATTELAVAVENGVSGWIDTEVDRLVKHMRRLIDDPVEARRLGDGARRRAQERYGIDRFCRSWDTLLRQVVTRHAAVPR